ncbi:sepiapterin reductase a [Salarias fasciatus]|uniref:Sepiapterin reductase n=1 Tax=Salarias fasciatus TaxID=181472 RepID=A0A672GNA0_SALFA|nr:sepiapterin reductase [Salarias fasciatus]
MSAAESAHLGRALCIITGASRGFGRAVALDLSRLLLPGSVLVLAARSGADLRAVEAELAGRAGLSVRSVEADVGQSEGLDGVMSACKEASSADIDHLILINNAASLGDVSRFTTGFTSLPEVDSYMSLNVSSPLCLTAGVLRAVPRRAGLRRTVVNVSSLCALRPFRSWVLYCTGKAARDMTFRVLAEEEPDVRVLSYSPGPLDTDMQREARSHTADPDIRKSFSDMFSEGQLLSCQASCAKLLKLLLEDAFTSGDHVDVYDV